MANRYVKNLIPREDIKEDMKLIEGSITDYITPLGNVYKYYKSYNGYYKKKAYINPSCGYLYVSITIDNGKNVNRRLHKLVALAYVENPKPKEYFVVGHKDNNKINDIYTNLYWTSTQENTNKAIQDGLLQNKVGIENINSMPIKVLDLKNNLISVYGSLRETCRMIKNLNLSYLSKITETNNDYKPRGKKYKYFTMSKDEYDMISDTYKNKELVENVPSDKTPSIFKATNIITGETLISDNQKDFAINHNLKQASISHAIRNNSIYKDWQFEFISKIDYTDSSGFKKFFNGLDGITVKNVETEELKHFDTKKELKEYFNLKGNDLLQYLHKGNLIYSKWEIAT